MTSTIKNIIVFTSIGAILVLLYVFLIKKDADQAPLVSVQNSGAVSVTNTSNQNSLVAGEFLSVLLSVKNIKLDDSIFSDAVFSSLSDSSIYLIPDGTEGRPNPFAPLGAGNIISEASTSNTSAISTTSNTNTEPALIP